MGGVPFHDIAQHVVFLRIAGTAVVGQIRSRRSSPRLVKFGLQDPLRFVPVSTRRSSRYAHIATTP
jgi:hypothetical protein